MHVKISILFLVFENTCIKQFLYRLEVGARRKFVKFQFFLPLPLVPLVIFIRHFFAFRLLEINSTHDEA